MDDGLKQRLVGAIVLVALAVIFIPMIFNDAKLGPEDIRVAIPPRPEVPLLEIKKPKVLTRQAEKQQELTDAKEETPAVAEQPPEILPNSWTLQLASFQERANADLLRNRLRESGYKAYVKFRPHEQPPLARVFVGPELDRKILDKYKQDLQKQFKLEGIVVRFMQDE